MRVSVEKEDGGYSTYETMVGDGKIVRIFLNGVEMHDVITADDDLGVISHYRRDDQSRLIADPEGFLRLHHSKGVVKIEAQDRN